MSYEVNEAAASRVRSWSIGAAWLLMAAGGMLWFWQYAGTPGVASATMLQSWPSDSAVHRDTRGPTLLLFVHPNCPCSKATLGELERLLAVADKRLPSLRFVIALPPGTPAGWGQPTYRDAARRFEAQIIEDIDGVEARRFGATTSGHVLVVDADGRVQFSGGITPGRGHEGANDGAAAVELALRGEPSRISRSPVYGCPLATSEPCPVESVANGADCGTACAVSR